MSRGKIFLCMPGYGRQTADAGRSFWRACRDMSPVVNDCRQGSLLATNFNKLWCNALNLAHKGERLDYLAMNHDDVGAVDYWLDEAIEELESHDLDILGVVVPIKDERGISSLALHNGPIENRSDKFEGWLDQCGVDAKTLNADQRARLLSAFAVWINRTDENNWRPFCRLSMRDVFELPETFTSDDVGRPLLINTGLWVCKFNLEWAKRVHFEINNRICFDPKEDYYHEQTEPEDWFFSRLCHELGLRIGATRKITVKHRGETDFHNARPWGHSFDREYTNRSPIPNAFPYEIPGWLTPNEGRALAELSSGKRVLEIGSYCGRSTVCIARTASHVHCIDPFDGRDTKGNDRPCREIFDDNIERYEVADKVTVSQCVTSEADVTERFDVVFIDGSHDYESVQADIAFALSVVDDAGLIAFHDYNSAADPDVAKAVDELIGAGGRLVSTHDSLAVVKPPANILLEV